MDSGIEMVRGLALTSFAVGALLIALGDGRRGDRAIAFAIVLAAVEPLLAAGIRRLSQLEVPNGYARIGHIVIALFLAAVVLAGLVALRRTRSTRGAEPTSQKKRVERAP